MAGTARRPAADERRRWRALAVGLAAAFMTLLDVSIVNVALPSIERSLAADPHELQWVLSGYALAFGLVLVPAGRFGDAYGQRGVFIVGLAAFTVASAAAGLAGSPGWLIAARLVQGAAGGLVNPQVTGLIQNLFRGAERGRPFGLLGATIGVSTAVGPLLGGLLIEAGGPESGWRWVFFVNLPVGVAVIGFARRLLPAPPADRPADRGLDPFGVLLLGAAVLLILLPLVQQGQWRQPWPWLLVPAGLALLAGFAAWERRYGRRREPVFDLGLFGLRSYALGVLIALTYFGGFTAIFFVLTLYWQNGQGYRPLLAGLAITPFALGSAAGSAAGGRLVNRFGRPLVAVGLVLVVAGLATVLALSTVSAGHRATLLAAGPLLVAGFGSGLVITPNQTLTLAQVPVHRAGSAAGMLQTGQRIGSAAGIAVVGAVFFAGLAGPRPDWGVALRAALGAAIGLVLAALVAAVVDVAGDRRGRSPGRPVAAPPRAGRSPPGGS